MEDESASNPQEDPEKRHSLWNVMNSSLLTIFNDLSNDGNRLLTFLGYIVNSKQLFSATLVPTQSATSQILNEYESFDKWLLGRLFYLLSVEELNKIHSISVNAQVKILSVLYLNNVNFYNKICNDYIVTCSNLMRFLKCSDKDQSEVMILKMLTPNVSHIENTEITLIPLYVTVSKSKKNEELLKYMLEITCHIMISSYDNHFNVSMDEILLQNIFIFENFGMKLKIKSINIFAKVLNQFGLSMDSSFIHNFLLLIENLILNLYGFENEGLLCHQKQKQINDELDGVLMIIQNYSQHFNESNCSVIYNICKFILNSENYSAIDASYERVSDNTISITKVIDPILQKRCAEIVELLFSSKMFITNDIPNIKYHIKNSPSIFSSSVMAQLKMFIFTKSDSQVVIDMMDKSSISQKLISMFILFLESACSNDIDLFVIKEHLETCLNILDIILSVTINFYSSHQEHNKLYDYIFTFEGKKIKRVSLFQQNVYLKCLLREQTSLIVKTIQDILKKILRYKSDSFHEVSLCTQLCMKALLLTGDVYFQDFLSILQIQSFAIKQDSEFVNPSTNLVCSTKYHTQCLNILLLQMFLLNGILDDEHIKKEILNTIDYFHTAGFSINAQMIKCSPLMMLNKILTSEKDIQKLFISLLSLNNKELLNMILKVLPSIICILYGHYCIFRSMLTCDFEYELFSESGIQLSIVCLHCYHLNDYLYDKSQIKNKLKRNKSMVEVKRSLFSHSSKNDNTDLLIPVFSKLSEIDLSSNVSSDILHKFILISSHHSLISTNMMKKFLSESDLKDMQNIIKSFFSIILNNQKLDNSDKRDVLDHFANTMLKIIKSSLEKSEIDQQELCLEIIKQFGMSRSKDVLLPSVKMLIFYIMYFDCPFGNKATLYLKDVCESHSLSPNMTYHMYKKDICRMIVDMTAFNYLAEKEFIPSFRKVVLAFEFLDYREFISQEIQHVLPYLIPKVVQLEKLKNIIQEICSLIPCLASELLSERFAHIYTHIYIYESESVAKKCYEYIEQVTNCLLKNLIKKHSQLILTELLIQYCSNPERVIKACKRLTNIDAELHSSQISSTPLSQVADYIKPKMLGVLANIDNKLIQNRVALSVKRKVLQSFPHIINLMGSKHITVLRFKILATLRTSLLTMKDYPDLNIDSWNAFVRNVETTSLGPMLTTVIVSLLPLLSDIPVKINEILEYLIVNNGNILSTYISDLFFLEMTQVSDNIKRIVHQHVKNQPKIFVDKIQWFMQYLNHDTLEVKVYALRYLCMTLKDGRQELDSLIFNNKNINQTIPELLETLITGCKNKDVTFSEWSSRCLGQIGALHPSLLPCKSSLLKEESQFAFTVENVNFVRMALIELARVSQFEKDTKHMDCYSLAIQQMLNIFKISPDGENKDIWESFPENLHQIMIPLLSSRYVLAYPTTPVTVHPVYGSSCATTFSEWGYNWTGQLISQINHNEINKMFQTILPALKKEHTLMIFMPYIVLHAILTNDETDFVKEEIMSIIGLESFNNESANINSLSRTMRCPYLTPTLSPIVMEEGTHIKCCKSVYNLFDFFYRWLMEWRFKSEKTINDEYIKVNNFLESFCKLTIACGNFLSGELERALQYVELYMEKYPEQIQKQLGFLGEIYAVLNEPDSISGIMRMKENEPSLLESILAHEVTGQLQDAATCYEKYAQQGKIENEKLQGMVNVYLGLDQPYTALKLLQDVDDIEMETLNAEPFWRLGMFDELDKLLERADVIKNDSWGVTVGHCLLALRSGVRENVEEKLKIARQALMRKLDQSASYMSMEESVYSRAYSTAFSLHMLSEIEQVEEFIFKIKDLQDDDEMCSELMNGLNTEWSLRLKLLQSSTSTFEPVLRLRRILLEQSKELLKSSHPGIVPLLDVQIGKLWLHSAKFARKSGTYQQAYIYILNGEKYAPKELFIEKAKLYWMRNQQEQAFCTLKRVLEERYSNNQNLSLYDKKLCAKAKLLIAIYNDETSNVDMDVNVSYFKDAVEVHRQWEKSLVFYGEYLEKVYAAMTNTEKKTNIGCTMRLQALECYGRSLQYGHKRLYQSMPRMLTIWLDFEISEEYKTIAMSTLAQMCNLIESFTDRLPLYLFLTAISQIISRICHPVKEVYMQLKSIIVKLILAYPQHTIWMIMCVIGSSYPQRAKRCREILNDPRLSENSTQNFINRFVTFAENLIKLCNTPIPRNEKITNVSALVKNFPKILEHHNFVQIMMPHEKFVKLSLPFTMSKSETVSDPFPSLVYVSGIEEQITILPSLQRPRKVTLKGSDGKKYIIMLKPKDDLRKDFRLMEFNAVVNRYLQDNPEARERRLRIRTYAVLPLNEECGIIEWIPNLVGLRPILINTYKTLGKFVPPSKLREFMCKPNDPIMKKKKIFESQLLPLHPPVFGEWFRYTFPDPHSWFQARTAYIRTTAVMSMVGYILGLGDRHGENILFDSTNGDTVHVDFNCLFNKGEELEYPEKVPFRLTHNMLHAMGPLRHEGMFRKCCEITMHVLRAQTPTLMAVIRPFVYDPLVIWQKSSIRADISCERTNQSAKENLMHIESRLQGTVRSQGKICTLSLSAEGQTHALIQEAISVVNLCQMYIGWAPFY